MAVRILVVDDDFAFREVLSRAIRELGHQVDEAANGQQAIELIQANKYNVVVTDVLMPEKDGIETIRLVRKKWPSVKIIAMSGGGRVGPSTYLQMAEQLGVSGTLAKPFSTGELKAALTSVFAE